ncbi:sulfotransferase [Eilatimonas milleporae]|uniref:Glycosyl transferase family 2 n=1 Tax=Eilatimonas milleporae TaxID=911205 RepID=A0A3M0CTZ2_9PROT|nr:sulfotransferase [Eilatimonas milleporae]RMB12445.1 glycosyl transferase family 2 [Eilatimonas milleporae]
MADGAVMSSEASADTGGGAPIGVVIPAYGHPKFLAEAIISACTQSTERAILVVVVEDGCPFAETGQVVRGLLGRFPGRLFHLRQANTRLPGARNTGIRFLLDMAPDLDAVFFLDADNRLEPYAIESYRRVLGDNPATGWAYPDIALFGLSWGEEGFDIRETAPDYSVLKHLSGNISEAGSLVRADLFRAGLFFDESMRAGFEDWDFWLSAIAAGFRGRRVRDAGFLYRRRPESMLSDARRGEDPLLVRMKRKHADLFNPRFLMRTVEREAPTFALWLADRQEVLFFADPLRLGRAYPLADFIDLCRRRLFSPREIFFPEQVFITTAAIWRAMTQRPRNLRTVFWRLRGAASDILFCRVADGVIGDLHIGAGDAADAGGFTAIHKSVFLRFLAGRMDMPSVPDRAVVAGFPVDRADAGPQADAAALLDGLRRHLPVPRAHLHHHQRRYAGPDADTVRAGLVDDLTRADEIVQPFPLVRDASTPLVALAVPTRFLTCERACDRLRRIVRLLSERGAAVTLVAEFDPTLQGLGRAARLAGEGVVDLVPLRCMTPDGPDSLGYRPYLGHRAAIQLKPGQVLEIQTALMQMDAVVALGASAMVECLGALRPYGVKGFVLADPAFMDERDTRAQTLARLLAYEHAEDAIFTDTAEIVTELAAMGVPRGKIDPSSSLADRVLPARPRPVPSGTVAPGWRPKDGFVFVVTYGRSGSTLLQTLLQSIDGYFFRGENANAFLPVFDSYRRALSLRHKFNIRRPVPPTGPWYGADEVDPDAYARALTDVFIRQVLRPSAGARVVGFKEIRYHEIPETLFEPYLDFIRDMFAPAKIIFNMRDWRAVIKSSWWATMLEGKVRDMVETADAAYRDYADRHADSCFLLNYDDYKADPEALKPLFDFLGEPFSPDHVRGLMTNRLKH